MSNVTKQTQFSAIELKDRATCEWRAGRLESAHELIDEAFALTPFSDIDFRLLLTNNKALFARAQKDMYEAIRLQTEAGHLAAHSSDNFLIGNHYHGLGITNEMLYERTAQSLYVERAHSAFKEAILRYEIVDKRRERASSLNCIAYLFVRAEQPERALEYSAFAVRGARAAEDECLVAECLLTRAQAFSACGDHASAMQLALDARKVFEAKGYTLLLNDALDEIERITRAMRS